MKFKFIKTINSLGCIIPTTIKVKSNGETLNLKKGTKVNKKIIKILLENSYQSLKLFKLDPEDVHENIAATYIADCLCFSDKTSLAFKKLNTGRTNIIAKKDGLFFYKDLQLINLNYSPDIAISAIKQFSKVKKGQDLVTVKVIPYGVKKSIVENIISKSKNCFHLAPFEKKKVDLIQTFKNESEKNHEKAKSITIERLKNCGINNVKYYKIYHDEELLSKQINISLKGNSDLILIIGPHAITHLKDVIPSAVSKSGAKITRFGIPVEPGNLMLLSKIEKKNKTIFIIGMPSCSKSPKENGLDWILWRILANVRLDKIDIDKLAIGGLIK